LKKHFIQNKTFNIITDIKIFNFETGLYCYRSNKNCKYWNWFILLQK